ncbi:hypothetical protein [Rhodococcus sp. NPDC058521]|uniref:hypothetical protein n=1 Tax=Rhodococcus sp. NPDC058521 TaxID=3346536 RepID=UPI003664D1F3
MALTSLDRKLIGWSALFVASQLNIARLLGPAAPRVLEAQTAFSAGSYTAVLDKMDAADTARYRSHFYPDFVHPAIYAIALSTGTRRLAELTPMSPTTRRVFTAAPVVSAAGDYVENVVGLYLLDHRDRITDTTVRATSTVSVTKWVLALGTLGFLSQGFVRVWAKSLLRR